MPLEGLCTRQLWTLPYRQKIETSLSLSWSLSLSTQAQKTKELVLAGPVGPVLLQGGKSSVHTACKAHSREYTSPQARLGPWARKLSTPLRPVFESHDSQYIDRKTRRSPSRWSHSLTLPRAPRTVRTAFYMTCFIFTGVSSKPHVRVGNFLFLAEKKSEFTKRNFGCEFGICFLPNKKNPFGGKKVRHVWFQVHQKSSKSARIENGKKLPKLGTPIEIST